MCPREDSPPRGKGGDLGRMRAGLEGKRHEALSSSFARGDAESSTVEA